MRQILIRIPLDAPWCFGPFCLPGFGWGVVLAVWVILGGLWLYRNRQVLKEKENRLQLVLPGIIWLVVAAAIIHLPEWVHRSTDRALATAQQTLQKADFGTPLYREAHRMRDRAWRQRRRFAEAVQTYQSEIEKHPDFAPAYYRLAWILATAPDDSVRDTPRAVKLARRAVHLAERRGDASDIASAYDVLAAALAGQQKFSEAIQAAQKAAALAVTLSGAERGAVGDLVSIRQRLHRYRTEMPYRDVQAGKFLPVYGYGFLLFLGFVTAGWTAMRRAETVGVPKEIIWDVCLWVLVGGIGGARLFYVVQYHRRVFAGAKTIGDYVWAVLNLREGGLVLYGGILLALTAFVLFCRRRKLSPLLMTDVIMPSFFLGLAFGRIGCFMNGCCYGDPCTLSWCIRFPLGSIPDMALVGEGLIEPTDPLTLPLQPTQLYSALNALLLSFLLHCYFRMRPRDGVILGIALLTYPVTRFLIEFLRGDEPGQFQTALTISQWVSVGLFLSGVVYLVWLSRRPRVLTRVCFPSAQTGDSCDSSTPVASTSPAESVNRNL